MPDDEAAYMPNLPFIFSWRSGESAVMNYLSPETYGLVVLQESFESPAASDQLYLLSF